MKDKDFIITCTEVITKPELVCKALLILHQALGYITTRCGFPQPALTEVIFGDKDKSNVTLLQVQDHLLFQIKYRSVQFLSCFIWHLVKGFCFCFNGIYKMANKTGQKLIFPTKLDLEHQRTPLTTR